VGQINDLLHGAIQSFIAKCHSFSKTGDPLIQVGASTEAAGFEAVYDTFSKIEETFDAEDEDAE
jgi:hypothetical protein